MSAKMYQELIQKTRDVTDRVIGVVDETRNIVACTDLSMIGQTSEPNLADYFSMSDVAVINGYTYRVIGSRVKFENFVFVKGADAAAESLSPDSSITPVTRPSS